VFDLWVTVMLSSLTDLSGRLQGGEWCKMNDCAALDEHNDVSCSEKTSSMNERSEHTEKVLSSNALVKDLENLDSTEVSVEGKFDSGFSWVIVCASFINCFTIGVMFIGFSILYVEISEYFDSSKAVAGWIGSLYMASGNIFGKKSHSLCFAVSADCRCLGTIENHGKKLEKTWQTCVKIAKISATIQHQITGPKIIQSIKLNSSSTDDHY